MLDITKKTLTLELEEVMELERIIVDEDKEEAYRFLKKNLYKRFLLSQENKLKSHLDGCTDPTGSFAKEK